jgi:molecular chaperone GrpE
MPSSPESEQEALARDDAGPEAPEGDLADELARAQDLHRRALADLDNYRKRSTRDAFQRTEDARAAVVGDWLEALDSVERALRTAEPESALFQGLHAVLDQMDAILAREGVRRVGAIGDQFDPQLHHAVGVHHTPDVPDQTIVDVVRSGFALGERVIRPAEVIVARTDVTEAE